MEGLGIMQVNTFCSFLFYQIQRNRTVWVKVRNQLMIPDLQKCKQSLLFAFFIIFSSEGQQTVYVQVEVGKSTDEHHFRFTPSLRKSFSVKDNKCIESTYGDMS